MTRRHIQKNTASFAIRQKLAHCRCSFIGSGIAATLGVAALATGLLAALPETAHACGGFFCSQSQPVNQAAERIVFADNGDGTITAVIQIMYEGPSENFSWLLPISSVPEDDEIAVASDLAFQRLQQATNPQYNLTTQVEGTCRTRNNPNLVESGASAGGFTAVNAVADNDSGVTIAASGVVGSFEWTVLELDPSLTSPADTALQWLTDNDYDVNPGSAELIGPYLEEGRYLLALSLTKGSDSGSIRPLVLTYDAELPDIPLKLTAVAANDDMGVMTWVVAQERAVPFNYNALELNEARINWFNASVNYNQVVIEAANDASGQGFVTEYARPSNRLAEVVWSNSEEQDWQRLSDPEEYAEYTEPADYFESLYFQYSGFDGFWDAVRATVTLPAEVAFEDFQDCPSCFEVEFDHSAYVAALNAQVIEPMRSFQKLLDSQPYTTRLYSTLSAAEMTVDPVFAYNPDLDNVNNIHRATRYIECNGAVDQNEANWRIELPQGGVIRGSANSIGNWPSAVSKQAANFRILRMSTSGQGDVLENNEESINAALSDYNATVPRTRRSGWCSLGLASGAQPVSPGYWFAFAALAGATLRRRRRRRLSIRKSA